MALPAYIQSTKSRGEIRGIRITGPGRVKILVVRKRREGNARDTNMGVYDAKSFTLSISIGREVFIADLIIPYTGTRTFEPRETRNGCWQRQKNKASLCLSASTLTLRSFAAPHHPQLPQSSWLALASFLSPIDAHCTIILDHFRSGILRFRCLISIRACFQFT